MHVSMRQYFTHLLNKPPHYTTLTMVQHGGGNPTTWHTVLLTKGNQINLRYEKVTICRHT